MNSFSNKTAIVTGAASGMGKATAELLSSRGAQVCGVDIDPGVSQVGLAMVKVGTVADSKFCNDVAVAVVDQMGAIDILINAAGVIIRTSAAATDDAAWRRIFDVNVDGTFFMSRAVVGHMLTTGGGSIVNFGSVWGDVGANGQAAYAASKGAVHLLTKSMALEHAREGIRINAVCPGEIRTPMLLSERAAPLTESELQAMVDRVVPMGRLGDPGEIAEVVAFLASDAASYMTGSLVVADAGYTAQ